jgi:hypothetical protein
VSVALVRREVPMATIHLIHIPDRKAREQALREFLGVRETWVSFAGNILGVTNEHIQALVNKNIPFDYVSKTSPNGSTAPVQS